MKQSNPRTVYGDTPAGINVAWKDPQKDTLILFLLLLLLLLSV